MIASWSSGDDLKLWNFLSIQLFVVIVVLLVPLIIFTHLHYTCFDSRLSWVPQESCSGFYTSSYFHFSPLYFKVEVCPPLSMCPLVIPKGYNMKNLCLDLIEFLSFDLFNGEFHSIVFFFCTLALFTPVWKGSDNRFSRSLCSFSNNEVREVFTFPQRF